MTALSIGWRRPTPSAMERWCGSRCIRGSMDCERSPGFAICLRACDLIREPEQNLIYHVPIAQRYPITAGYILTRRRNDAPVDGSSGRPNHPSRVVRPAIRQSSDVMRLKIRLAVRLCERGRSAASFAVSARALEHVDADCFAAVSPQRLPFFRRRRVRRPGDRFLAKCFQRLIGKVLCFGVLVLLCLDEALDGRQFECDGFPELSVGVGSIFVTRARADHLADVTDLAFLCLLEQM